MGKLRKALATAAVAFGVVGTSVTAAAPAQAAGPSNCELGFFCNYKDINYGNKMTSFQFYIPVYASQGMHDNISGVWNQGRTSNARIYKDEFYGGSSYLIPRGNGDGNMHDAIGTVSVSGWADSIDSAQFL